MLVVLGLLAFFLLLDISALTGWAPSTRDSRDWRRPEAAITHSDGHSSAARRVTAIGPTPSGASAPEGTHAVAL